MAVPSVPGLSDARMYRGHKGGSTMRGSKTWTSTVFVGLMALALPAGLVWANNVRIEGGPPGSVVVVPGQPAATGTLQADEITAQQVRASTIYANRIEA